MDGEGAGMEKGPRHVSPRRLGIDEAQVQSLRILSFIHFNSIGRNYKKLHLQ